MSDRLALFLRMSSLLLILCFAILCASSCARDRKVEKRTANVLLYWPTDESDPVFQTWTEIAKEELSRQGISGEVTVHFGHVTERYESVERPAFNELIMTLASQGRKPDLVLAYGDYVHWLLQTNTNSLVCSIPTVCYGLQNDRILPYMAEMVERNYNGGRHNLVEIRARLCLKENIALADSLTPILVEKIRRPDYYMMSSRRFITLLDGKNLWADLIKFEDLAEQAAKIDPAHFYDNLVHKEDELALRAVTERGDSVIFSCRSLMTPKWTLDPKYNQIATTWAFFPQKSPYFYIASKHDYSSRNLVEGPNFLQYYTMVAEEFLVYDNCIGGYFPVFEDQISDAVRTGIRLLDGENPSNIEPMDHKPAYHLNWDVLRPLGLNPDQVPDFVHLYNVQLKDRSPRLFSLLNWLAVSLFLFLVCWSFYTILSHFHISRRNNLQLRKYSQESIQDNLILNRILAVTDTITWEEKGNNHKLLHRLTIDDSFFRNKITELLESTAPGNYSMELYCSIDNNPPHWYDLRMTTRITEDAEIERRGLMVNIDLQKETEAREAEVNRIFNKAKTREGFIASINHEIRTPLNSIVGFSQILSVPDMLVSDEELEEYASSIEANSIILQRIMENILISTNIGTDKIMPNFRETSIDEVIDALHWESLVGTYRVAHDNLLILRGPKDMKVMTDPNLLRKIIENIAINAAKFSDKSSVITVGWGAIRDGKWSSEIWIKDQGIGILPELRDMIFNRFFKGNSFEIGCGLGLYVSKEFADMIGGNISFKSKVGEGTTFRIKLA